MVKKNIEEVEAEEAAAYSPLELCEPHVTGSSSTLTHTYTCGRRELAPFAVGCDQGSKLAPPPSPLEALAEQKF